MTEENVENKIEESSFDWYVEIGEDDKFFKYLTKAFMHADSDNLQNLKRVFQHIGIAHSAKRWDVKPLAVSYSILANMKRDLPTNIINPKTGSFESGCFNRYLFGSGSFVTYMANVILYADMENLRRIRSAYPQKIEAYIITDWDKAPESFTGRTYNSLE